MEPHCLKAKGLASSPSASPSEIYSLGLLKPPQNYASESLPGREVQKDTMTKSLWIGQQGLDSCPFSSAHETAGQPRLFQTLNHA